MCRSSILFREILVTTGRRGRMGSLVRACGSLHGFSRRSTHWCTLRTLYRFFALVEKDNVTQTAVRVILLLRNFLYHFINFPSIG